MSSLYELTGNRLALQRRLESMNFDEETIQDSLEGESAELESKIENYGFVILNRHALTNAIETEIKRLQDRLVAESKRIANIEAWLLQNMIVCGISKIESVSFTISVQNNPPKVEIFDEKQIPSDYWRTPEPKPPVAAPDKRLILTAIKDGFDVPGCVMTQSARLVIK